MMRASFLGKDKGAGRGTLWFLLTMGLAALLFFTECIDGCHSSAA